MKTLYRSARIRIPAALLLGMVALISVHNRQTGMAAGGAAQRTFVSGGGSDSNPCSRGAPCRSFAQAVSQTSPGGEVIVLDSAGYGPFSINQPVSIIASPGVYAGISVFSGDGIDINAGASDAIILRGLTINSQGTSGSGIVFSSGGRLHVENCVVNGFTSQGGGLPTGGVVFPGSGILLVKDTVIRGNSHGIYLGSFGSALRASVSIDGVHLEANWVAGIYAVSTALAAIRNSAITSNGIGISVYSTGFGNFLDVDSCLITNNSGAGLGVSNCCSDSAAAGMSISNCTISHNASGFSIVSLQGNAFILSRGNNTIIGNGPSTGSLTPFSGQ